MRAAEREPRVEPPIICDVCDERITRTQTLVSTPDGTYHLGCFVGSPDAV